MFCRKEDDYIAFDLRAILRLDSANFNRGLDRATRAMERANRQAGLWRDSQGRLRNSLGQYASQAGSASRATDSFSRGLGNAGRSIGSAITSLGGLASAIGGVYLAYEAARGAAKVFEATVGAAAKFENSEVMIGALFNDSKLAKQYTDMVDSYAIDSPIMNSQDMYGNSKSFITMTKDIRQLEKAWSLAERMAAIDPYQGVEGAVFALREIFSGSAISMVRRFEFPLKVMNAIKDLPLEQQLVELDKYFNKIGMTTKMIDKAGETTIGVFNRVKESLAKELRKMGEPSLAVVTDFLNNILGKLENGELDRFANVGARWIKAILTGLTNGVLRIYEWFTALTASEEFKEQTTVYGKVDFIISDIYARFIKWLDSEGSAKIQAASEVLVQTLAAAIDASMPAILPVAVKIGGAIGQGVMDGFNAAVKDSFIMSALGSPDDSARWAKKKATETVGGFFLRRWLKNNKTSEDNSNSAPKSKGSRNGGANRVHSDGLYRLHKDEAVLPRGEAADYRAGKSGGNTYQFNVTLNGSGSTEKDAEKLFELFVKKVERAGGAGA
ncbi:hypothetical protein [Peribacillus huizhouensis]|uniref:Phage tail tape measure protein n=1 Tax=Peribacillus huizhouensis TaxID=1501239 RepID=A0ABR6CR58_9BACI|nr:hypothetical protein [Peribacillus huizhouensis]MBA9027514.1 hypothetical protein [Peribacillus huizhouensis]